MGAFRHQFQLHEPGLHPDRRLVLWIQPWELLQVHPQPKVREVRWLHLLLVFSHVEVGLLVAIHLPHLVHQGLLVLLRLCHVLPVPLSLLPLLLLYHVLVRLS